MDDMLLTGKKIKQNFSIDNYDLINFIYISDAESEMVRNWRNNDDIKKWMYTDHIITPEEHKAHIEKLMEDRHNVCWLIKDADGEYLGVLNFIRLDSRNKNAYFGLYANPYSKTAGIGRILVTVAIKLAFQIIDLHSLRLEVIEDNRKVINLYFKAGFKEEGRLKEFVFKDGAWKDVIIMGMVANADSK